MTHHRVDPRVPATSSPSKREGETNRTRYKARRAPADERPSQSQVEDSSHRPLSGPPLARFSPRDHRLTLAGRWDAGATVETGVSLTPLLSRSKAPCWMPDDRVARYCAACHRTPAAAGPRTRPGKPMLQKVNAPVMSLTRPARSSCCSRYDDLWAGGTILRPERLTRHCAGGQR